MKTTTQKVLDYIRTHDRPSAQEIADACGLSSRAHAMYHVKLLCALRLVNYDPSQHRSIKATGTW